MKKPTNTTSYHHSGFALIEVLLAALVLTIGSLAFLKLQNLSLQTSFNDYAKTQGSTTINNFIEQLRANPHFTNLSTEQKNNFIIGGTINASPPPQNQSSCQSDQQTKQCATGLLNYQRYLTSHQMQTALPAKNSLLCYREHTDKRGFMRLDFLWLDDSKKDKTATLSASDCPKNFNAASKADKRNHQVTIYAQL